MRTVSVSQTQLLKRRSSRVALSARIKLSGHDRAKCAFNMPARASKLNKHGAAIQLNRELLIGSTIVLQNNHHAQASARVIRQVGALQDVYTHGVEFLESDAANKNFWGINFPSPDFVEQEGSHAEKRPPSLGIRRRGSV